MDNEEYLVQIFERAYYGEHFLEESVVIGSEGIKEYLRKHTFIESVIDSVLRDREFYSMFDIIRILEKNPDGSFDFYN